MKREGELPEGLDQIRVAVRTADDLLRRVTQYDEAVTLKRAELAEAEAVLVKAKAAHRSAAIRLRDLVALGGSYASAQSTAPAVAELATDPPPPVAEGPHFAWLAVKSLPIVWRIALMLADNPVLDYQGTARRLYGETDYLTAKNRVNAHIAELRKMGLVETLGRNTFRVQRAKLIQRSKRPLPEVPPI